MLAPELRQILLKLSSLRASQAAAKRALKALAGFAKGLKIKFQDIEVGLDLDPEKGLADNGDLESDLLALLTVTALAISLNCWRRKLRRWAPSEIALLAKA